MKRGAVRMARGFTVLELLLTVTVGALVTVAGTGLYRWSRQQADIAVSSRNLRQLAAANLNYAQDHNGRYCPAQDQSNLRRWHGGRKKTDEAFEAAGGFLTPYFGLDAQLEACPLFRKLVDAAVSFEEGAGGYGYNAAYIGGTPEDWGTPAGVMDVETPGRTVMFATTALSRAEGLQEYPFAEPFFWPLEDGGDGGELQPSVHFRAGGRAIVAWCDGQVTLEKPSVFRALNFYGGDNEKQGIGWFGPQEENGYWNPRSAAVRDGVRVSEEVKTGRTGGGGSEEEDKEVITLEPPVEGR